MQTNTKSINPKVRGQDCYMWYVRSVECTIDGFILMVLKTFWLWPTARNTFTLQSVDMHTKMKQVLYEIIFNHIMNDVYSIHHVFYSIFIFLKHCSWFKNQFHDPLMGTKAVWKILVFVSGSRHPESTVSFHTSIILGKILHTEFSRENDYSFTHNLKTVSDPKKFRAYWAIMA